ncbi:stage 0 sporulation family protein [Paenibacillus mesophilus]|uniref:PSP1 domain-containing protein n=1 Tax=Paenibacillus mesophilus TaxID=2582849 RepID=UPI00110F35D1|nr:stage 0 sporulation family protein [Paenibacillus mesophilus]TMV52240.1 stage 0 sporulation family protein [Paenibacillus mesophilus]
MYSVVGIRFKKGSKLFYFDPGDLQLEQDQHVIVDTVRGLEFGKVVVGKRMVKEQDVVLPLKPVIRVAGSDDYGIVEKNKRDAEAALASHFNKFKELKMKVVDAEWTFDRSKIFFYYTADSRVDFRELVKYLGSVFRTRVELRHIGVRDEAKLIGGLGPCGRILCCSSFLGELEPVSIKMAKDQNLSLNPAKISGLCGKLMCCLRFELDHYERSNESLPKVGQSIHTSYGQGKVLGVHESNHRIRVKFQGADNIKEFELDDPTINW